MSQINCKDLTLGYNGVPIVTGLTFSVDKGDYLAIIGDNGSGKTTLMKTLLGLITPIDGCLSIGERGEGAAHGEIGYLPQTTELGSDFPASVEEIVMSGFATKKGSFPFYSKYFKIRANQFMRDLGVYELRKKSFNSLSGGQKQRALLARALCSAGNVILLDEPVAGLDPLATEEMYSIIEHLCKAHGLTVIMITHDMSATVKYANKILRMGRHPVFYPTIEEYLKSQGLKGGE